MNKELEVDLIVKTNQVYSYNSYCMLKDNFSNNNLTVLINTRSINDSSGLINFIELIIY